MVAIGRTRFELVPGKGYDRFRENLGRTGDNDEDQGMKLRTFAIALTLIMTPTLVLADGDAKKGAKVFRKCKACHTVESTKNKVGPTLQGVIGRAAASVEGFKYSKAMKAAAEDGLVWTEDKIDEYLANPKGFIPKNKMAFVGLKKEKQRKNVIAYLKTFSAQ